MPRSYSFGSFTNRGAAGKIGSVKVFPWPLRVSSRNGVRALRTAAFLLRNGSTANRNEVKLPGREVILDAPISFLPRNVSYLSRNGPPLASAAAFPLSAGHVGEETGWVCPASPRFWIGMGRCGPALTHFCTEISRFLQPPNHCEAATRFFTREAPPARPFSPPFSPQNHQNQGGQIWLTPKQS